MDSLNEHFKIKEYKEHLSNLNKQCIEIKYKEGLLRSKLIREACLLASSLCVLLQINKDAYTIAYLLGEGSVNNHQAIQSWVLRKFVEVGFPYEPYRFSDLETKLEIKLNKLMLV